MPRTTAEAVAAIMPKDYDGTTSLTSFLEVASEMTDDVESCAADKGITLSDAKLEKIERYLTAWLYCQQDKPYASKNSADSGAAFHGQTGMGLDSNLYGQTAKRLDTSGCLAQIDAGGEQTAPDPTASGFWLGRKPSEQTDYLDRR